MSRAWYELEIECFEEVCSPERCTCVGLAASKQAESVSERSEVNVRWESRRRTSVGN
jgi:hypothetical protein